MNSGGASPSARASSSWSGWFARWSLPRMTCVMPEVGVVHDRREVVRRAAVGTDERDAPEAEGPLVVALSDGERGLAVAVGPLALTDRPFVPAEPEPLEVGEDLRLRPGHLPRDVRVVDAEDEDAAALVGEATVGDRGEGTADVERAGRARREPHADHPAPNLYALPSTPYARGRHRTGKGKSYAKSHRRSPRSPCWPGPSSFRPLTRVRPSRTPRKYIVLYESGASLAAAHAAVAEAGRRNDHRREPGRRPRHRPLGECGLRRRRSGPGRALRGREQPGDRNGAGRRRSHKFVEERLQGPSATPRSSAAAQRQARRRGRGDAWRRFRAPGSSPVGHGHDPRHEVRVPQRAAGRKGVLVGVIDTGIDGSQPDIAPNFDATLSRNFTTDIELIDGPCADEPDQSCTDPPDVDEDGHGTHVAGRSQPPRTASGSTASRPT